MLLRVVLKFILLVSTAAGFAALAYTFPKAATIVLTIILLAAVFYILYLLEELNT